MGLCPCVARYAWRNFLPINYGAVARGKGESMGTVLLIDDAPFGRELLGMALRSAGYDVLAAADTAEALTLLRARDVKLIVLDNQLHHIGGTAFLQQMRSHAEWAMLPVIMLTGSADKHTVLMARQYNVAEYVLKSEFSIPKFLARVHKYVLPCAAGGGRLLGGDAPMPGLPQDAARGRPALRRFAGHRRFCPDAVVGRRGFPGHRHRQFPQRQPARPGTDHRTRPGLVGAAAAIG